MKKITIFPIRKIKGIINLPGSKSISNRVLLLAAQAIGKTKIINLLDSEDVRYMLIFLKKIGINFILSKDRKICEIYGVGKPLETKRNILYLGNAGTVMRSLIATLSLKSKLIILTGNKRMKERPIGKLVDSLRIGGAKIYYLNKINYPPLFIKGNYLGGNIFIDGSISSQYITSLFMMAPLAPSDSIINIKGILVSKPYIKMTIILMKKFGINIKHKNYNTFYIKGRKKYISPKNFFIEGDASSASYFLTAAAINKGNVILYGIGRNSIQGDILFSKVLKKIGAFINLKNKYIECKGKEINMIDMDMNNIPDSALTLVSITFFTNKTFIIRNIYNWRIKETDRLKAMVIELRNLGSFIIEGKDFIKITPPYKIIYNDIYTYNDHRIAMSLSLIALSFKLVNIINPQCIKKTFPQYLIYLAEVSKIYSPKDNKLSCFI